MRSLKLKKKLRDGQVCSGAWMSFPDPIVAEVMAGVGFDWIMIDTEHSPFNLETLAYILMAFKESDTVPMIRMPWNDHVRIKQVLDIGAEGVLMPNVGSVEAARQAVAACRYPPEGTRGFGPRRASDYFRKLDPLDEYLQTANESIVVIIQIEDIDGVRNVESILAVPGIDVVLLGPMDLSGTMGLMGQLDHPDVLEAIHFVIAKAKEAGVPVGVPMAKTPEVLAEWISYGSQFASVGSDLSFLIGGATQALTTCRRAVSKMAQ